MRRRGSGSCSTRWRCSRGEHLGVPAANAHRLAGSGGAAHCEIPARGQTLSALAVRRLGPAGPAGAHPGGDDAAGAAASARLGGHVEDGGGARPRLRLRLALVAAGRGQRPAPALRRAPEPHGLAVFGLRPGRPGLAALEGGGLRAPAPGTSPRDARFGGGLGAPRRRVRKIRPAQLPRRRGRGPAHGLRLRCHPARPRPAARRRGRQGAAARAAAPQIFRRGAGHLLVPHPRAALVRSLHALCPRPRGQRPRIPLRPARAGAPGG